MTATLPVLESPELIQMRTEAPPAPAAPPVGQSWRWRILAAAVGTIIVALSYRLSALGVSAGLYYLVFWCGMLTALAPVAAALAGAHQSRATRLSAVAMLALLTAMPKLLRNFAEPSFHDEYAHWRQAVDVALSARLFAPNDIIPIVEFFPGTSALTTGASALTGLGPWSAGLLVVVITHVLGLYAVYLLGEVLLSSDRAGAIAALVFGINPSAIYFDTQYAYESVAIAFFLWTLALTMLAARARTARPRAAFLGAAVATAAACVVTHHLSTIFLIVALFVIAAAGTVHRLRRRRSSSRPRTPTSRVWVWWAALTATVCLALGWVLVFARPTLDYLSPYFGHSVKQLNTMAHRDGQGGRQLMAASVQPGWEQLLTMAAPLTAALAVLAAVILIRRRGIRLDWPAWGLMAFGLAYFLSIPFILAPSGAEGARRSWGFTYVGVALIVALVVVFWPPDRPRSLSGRGRSAVVAAALAVLLIGNVGGGLNDPYRFPGPFRWGTDTNSASDEARTVARELGELQGRVRVVADAYTALQLAAYGGLDVAAPAVGFPVWDLTQTGADPSPELARMIVGSHYDYLVVDIRMGLETPFNGHNFGQGDPLLGHATPMEYLTRLDSVPWAARVISTEHLRVYRLRLTDIASDMRTRR